MEWRQQRNPLRRTDNKITTVRTRRESTRNVAALEGKLHCRAAFARGGEVKVLRLVAIGVQTDAGSHAPRRDGPILASAQQNATVNRERDRHDGTFVPREDVARATTREIPQAN